MSSHRSRASGHSACAVVLLLVSYWLPGCTLQAAAVAGGDPIITEKIGDPIITEKIGDPIITEKIGDPIISEKIGDPIITERIFSAALSSGAAAAAATDATLTTLSIEAATTVHDTRERDRRSDAQSATSNNRAPMTTNERAPSSSGATPSSAPSEATTAKSSATVTPTTLHTNRIEPLDPIATSAKPPTRNSSIEGNHSGVVTTGADSSTVDSVLCLTNDTIELRKGVTLRHLLRPPALSSTCDCLKNVVIHPHAAGVTSTLWHNSSDNASSPSWQKHFELTLTDSFWGRKCVEFVCGNGSFFEPVDVGTGEADQLNVALGQTANSSLNITWHVTPNHTSGSVSGTLEKVYVITLSKANTDGSTAHICNISVHVCSEASEGRSTSPTINSTCEVSDNWRCSPLGNLCSRKCSGSDDAYSNMTCSFHVDGFAPWTNYAVQFENHIVHKRTNDTVPSEVHNFTAHANTNSDGTADKNVLLTWTKPDAIGVSTWYNLSSRVSHSSTAHLFETKELRYEMECDVDSVYSFTIKACSNSGCSKDEQLSFFHKPGKPKAKPAADDESAVCEHEATSSSFCFTLANAYDYFDARAGNLSKFSVALSIDSSHQLSDNELEHCSKVELGEVYRACLLWKDATKLRINAAYMIGEECKYDKSHCLQVKLQPDHAYCVFFIGYTSSGQSGYSSCFVNTRTKQDRTWLVVLIVILLLVLLALVAALLLLILRRRSVLRFRLPWESAGQRERRNDLEMTRRRLTTMHVPLKEFSAHVQRMHENSNLEFSRQFKDIKQLSPTHPFETAIFPGNVAKNRYADVMPFDHSRVHLITNDDDEYDGADYINANYIPGYNSPREYIATQGPLPSTLSDFWRMVWEQNVPTVVMLTSLVERGCTKCERYWPDAARLQKSADVVAGGDDDTPVDGICYDDIQVKPVSYDTYDSYDLTVLELEMGSTKKRVNHFYYRLWPDMSCPHDKEVFVNFVEQVRQSHQPGRHAVGPMVVHCSAGVGRTGTFIAVDVLLQRILVQPYIDIPSEVLSLREHRCRMVQTEDQYVFIHDCIAEAIDLLDANPSTKPSNGLTVSGAQVDDLKRSPVQRSPASKSPAVRSPASRSPASRSPAVTSPTLALRLPASRSPAPVVRIGGAASQQQSPPATAAVERTAAAAAAAADERDRDDDDESDDKENEEESDDDESSRDTPAEEGPLLGGGHNSGAGGRGGGGSLEV